MEVIFTSKANLTAPAYIVYGYKKMKMIFFMLLYFLYSNPLYAQDLQKPRLGFTFACANRNTNSFSLQFDFSGSAFDINNVFTIELSDSDGNFDTGNNKNLATIAGENSTFFNISGNFSFPEGTYGNDYKIRIVSSLPAMTGLPSDSFEAYFITSDQLILNNYTDVVLCGGTETISVNEINPDFTYVWFKDDVLISGETGSSLTVSQSGKYYAAIDYGACTQSGAGVRSNTVDTSVISPANFVIEGMNTVKICANETYELVASIDNSTSVYKWYKDGTLIAGLPDYTPKYTTQLNNQFGVYHLEIEIGGCSSKSQDVTIELKEDVNFDVEIELPATRVRLPGETIRLAVTHTANSPTFQWFKDGLPLPAKNQFETNAVEAGVYFNEVTDNSSSCPVSRNSPEYTILDATGFNVEIRTSTDYLECGSEETRLSIVGVKAQATDGNEYDLTSSQVSLLSFQWFKDGVALSGSTSDELQITSHNDNGEYYLDAMGGSISSESNRLNILLSLEGAEIQSSSVSNTLCLGETITFNLNIVPGFTYIWFKDGTEFAVSTDTLIIDEVGVYSANFEGFGCVNSMPEIEVVEFDDTVLKVNPPDTAVLSPGETVILEASGADSYQWLDEAGNVLSTNETVTINILGVYTLVGTVGTCKSERKINVVEDDGKLIIPNILTPFNGDDINDTWKLPNRFSFQNNVQVIIYNSRGEEVLNTTNYQNDWSINNNLKDGMLFYFKIIKDNNLIKAGTISILQ